MKISQDEVLRRAGEHQEQVRQNVAFSGVSQATTGSGVNVLNKPWCYLALAGLLFGFCAWGVAEVIMQADVSVRQELAQRANELNQDDVNSYLLALFFLSCLWFMVICSVIGFGLSSVEGFMDGNYTRAFIRGLIAASIGLLMGPVVCIAANILYNVLGGGGDDVSLVQIFARSLGWAFAGCFVAIVPGIMMWNGKKFWLGVAGGAIGGLLGGFLFDPIVMITQTDILSRLVGIVGFGVFAGLAMGLLEEAAKQGWLRVAAGLLTGKQFIIYKNPTVIGSSPKSEIYLFKDNAVMPSHAAIRIQGKAFVLESLDPNGIVHVNGQPITQRKLLNGDFINIGSTQFIFGTKDIQNT